MAHYSRLLHQHCLTSLFASLITQADSVPGEGALVIHLNVLAQHAEVGVSALHTNAAGIFHPEACGKPVLTDQRNARSPCSDQLPDSAGPSPPCADDSVPVAVMLSSSSGV